MMHFVKQLFVFIVALLVTATVAAAQAPSPTSLSTGWAKVLEMKGEVQVQLPAQTLVPASREMILPPGTSIQTKKGSALLQLQDGSEVLVKKNSSVLVKSPDESDQRFFDVLLGKIRAVVKKRLQGAPSFRLGTPSAVITVRGTQFEVAVKKNQTTEVTVYEGLVEVSGLSHLAPPMMLGPGYYIDVPFNGPPSRPHRTISTDDRLQAGGRSYSRQERERAESGDDRGETSRTPSSGGEHESPDD